MDRSDFIVNVDYNIKAIKAKVDRIEYKLDTALKLFKAVIDKLEVIIE